ncbi:PREDICTED: sarcolemmal membrane-associated protein-like [Colobus angolensis palliatus]|uniref:sarcolemmal membrane-associated protein-like n=1 Tax=Colobus angolensis palliatus TaxID=336983 RepID=UPI0005F54094|nr:PREDICTED: sarcolemmal membrane-associated protein-like [Colobus angolensis palliatus]
MFLSDDLQGAQSEIEAKQEIQHLRKELIEAQELARTSKQKCFELQALLEEERKAYRNQVEESTKQIQVLQVGELEKLRKEWNALETECHSLKRENVLLSSELQRQEKELHKIPLVELPSCGSASQLPEWRNKCFGTQGRLDYEKTQTVLSELKLKFEMTEQEKQSITDELKQCKNNLKLLREKGNNKPWPWMPMLAALVAVTAIVLYVPGLARASP